MKRRETPYSLMELAAKRTGDKILMVVSDPKWGATPLYEVCTISRIYFKKDPTKTIVFVKQSNGIEKSIDGQAKYGRAYEIDSNGKKKINHTIFYGDKDHRYEYRFFQVPPKRWHKVTKENIVMAINEKYPIAIKKGRKIETFEGLIAKVKRPTFDDWRIANELKDTGKITVMLPTTLNAKDLLVKY